MAEDVVDQLDAIQHEAASRERRTRIGRALLIGGFAVALCLGVYFGFRALLSDESQERYPVAVAEGELVSLEMVEDRLMVLRADLDGQLELLDRWCTGATALTEEAVRLRQRQLQSGIAIAEQNYAQHLNGGSESDPGEMERLVHARAR